MLFDVAAVVVVDTAEYEYCTTCPAGRAQEHSMINKTVSRM